MVEKKKNEVNDTLAEFAELYKTINTTVVSKEIGEHIWALWQKYTGRTDRWRGCSGCLIAKVRFLKKRCIEAGIILEDEEQNHKENTVADEAGVGGVTYHTDIPNEDESHKK